MNKEELKRFIEQKTDEFEEERLLDLLFVEHKNEFEEIIDSIEDEEELNILLSKLSNILSEKQEISEIDEVFIYTILYKILNNKLYEKEEEVKILSDIFMQQEVKRENYPLYANLICNEEFMNKLNNVTDDTNIKRAFLVDIIGEFEDKSEDLNNLCNKEFEFYGYEDKKVR